MILGLAALVVYAIHRRGDRPFVERHPTVARLVKTLCAGAGVGLSPIVALYVLVGITKVPRLLLAWWHAPVYTKAVMVGLTVGVALLVGIVARESIKAVASGVAHALNRQRWTLIALRTGMPWVALITTYLLALAFGIPWWAAAGLAVLTGLLGWYGGRLALAARLNLRRFSQHTNAAVGVSVQALTVTDDDGAEYYVATVESERMAWPQPDRLVDTVLRVAQARTDPERGAIPPTLESEFADALFQRGETDPETVRDGLRQTLREHLSVECDDAVPATDLHDQLTDEFPERVVERELRRWRDAGAIRWQAGQFRIDLGPVSVTVAASAMPRRRAPWFALLVIVGLYEPVKR